MRNIEKCDGVDISQINTYITNLIFLYFRLKIHLFFVKVIIA